MINKFRNEVVVQLNGRSYKLRATVDALVKIEHDLDRSFSTILNDVYTNNLRIRDGLAIYQHGIEGAGGTYDKDQLIADIEAAGVDQFGVGVIDFLKIALYGGDSLKKNYQANHPKLLKRLTGSLTSVLQLVNSTSRQSSSGR